MIDVILPPPSFPSSKETMTRYTIEQGSVAISYGTDHMTGYFLSVVDQRLMWEQNASEAVNGIAKKVEPGGNGAYFDLHTGMGGFGIRVSKEVIVEFMRRYGVPEDELKLVRAGRDI
ncbi:hypothetical protein IW261DRAFT_1564903 [Armillaria novae-zelandiae]|uniref:Uncharacterized protein n=1 Tax=Armillaria novae-zelandiae TaxID=153914 RepID=A0AA39P7P3_9AGAR|nr:hypothetical protein IW261DRAFT_1564903 [Armillaria novae-zelandiae]